MKHLPLILPLLPGLRWKGKLKILCKQDGRYVVGFDAIAPHAHTNERYVTDQVALTAKQLKDWTGWTEGVND
jgi:hypothetical protein